MRNKQDAIVEVRPALSKPTKASKAKRNKRRSIKLDVNSTMRALSRPDSTHILRRAGKTRLGWPWRIESA